MVYELDSFFEHDEIFNTTKYTIKLISYNIFLLKEKRCKELVFNLLIFTNMENKKYNIYKHYVELSKEEFKNVKTFKYFLINENTLFYGYIFKKSKECNIIVYRLDENKKILIKKKEYKNYIKADKFIQKNIKQIIKSCQSNITYENLLNLWFCANVMYNYAKEKLKIELDVYTHKYYIYKITQSTVMEAVNSEIKDYSHEINYFIYVSHIDFKENYIFIIPHNILYEVWCVGYKFTSLYPIAKINISNKCNIQTIFVEDNILYIWVKILNCYKCLGFKLPGKQHVMSLKSIVKNYMEVNDNFLQKREWRNNKLKIKNIITKNIFIENNF